MQFGKASRLSPSRRTFLTGGLAALASGLGSASAAPTGLQSAPYPTRIVSLDDGLTETLLGLGVTPIAMPQVEAWNDWVVEPRLPPGIVDLGTDREPNLELLVRLAPDLIITTPYLAAIEPVMARIAPTQTFSIYAPPGGHPYELSIKETLRLGALLGRDSQAQALIARGAATMKQLRSRLRKAADRPVLIVNFLDEGHLRIYGQRSLFQDVIDRCGLANGWTRPTNYWGFSTIGLGDLAVSPESRFLYFEPVAPGILQSLATNPVWNSLLFVRAGRIHRLPAASAFGMLPSAMRFGTLLSSHLADVENTHG
ncbi:ABC transporter substrate-binding protein [Labrys okinawensis]|uniref:ABC transporter substrate-binding protein n=1 Tax=Labrys okinawensis TaxID=346911 RepID=UPI0015E3D858|nr:ABC transporter substrate-binding protein [Labrys okinawensis]